RTMKAQPPPIAHGIQERLPPELLGAATGVLLGSDCDGPAEGSPKPPEEGRTSGAGAGAGASAVGNEGRAAAAGCAL
ncbi:MAG TPA: hypothetical protein PK954_00185, partial [Anaerolineales bacterium]|nr:hypothetical protein [Anaerolineales bacterium]